jgi:hypothetical protein
LKKVKFAEVSHKDKKAFGAFLSEDEELVLATGFGANYLRHQFALFMMLPGGIAWLIGAGVAYLYQFNIGYGLLAGLVASMVFAYLKTVWLYHSHRFLLTTRRVYQATLLPAACKQRMRDHAFFIYLNTSHSV